MKKLLVLMVLGLAFIACDYAKESVELNPDLEITWINPIGWYFEDVGPAGPIEVDFVPENSLDSYLTEFIFEYYDMNDNLFYQSEPMPLYAKIEGIVERPDVDTTRILNLYVPADTVVTYLTTNNMHSAKALFKFVFTDELFETTDTSTVWFGFYQF
jgi:hypothetical protein